MNPVQLIDFLRIIEKLKCNTRHCYTTSGRKESVAEHCWRTAVMAMLCRDEYPKLDMDRVIRMALVHDFGEAITGDVPAFFKTDSHEEKEKAAIKKLLATLPEEYESELCALFEEMEAMETDEAKLFKALDNLEAVVAHNESDLSTWIPMEFEENPVYGFENCLWSPWTLALREQLKQDCIKKIADYEAEKKEKNYVPAPVDTDSITLSPELLELKEKIAENVHEVWSKGRIEDGWRYGAERNDTNKTHPCLVPYEELSESEKEYDRSTAMETLKLITAFGYEIRKKD